MLEVVEPQSQLGVALPEFLVPLADGQQTGLLEAAGCRGRRREWVSRLSACHQLGQPLEVPSEELAEEM